MIETTCLWNLRSLALLAGMTLAMAAACERDTVQPPPEGGEETAADGHAATGTPETDPSGGAGSGTAATAPEVAPEPEPVVVPDFQLVTRIRMRLMADEVVDESTIRVLVSDSAVTLSGASETAAGKIRAGAIARATFGVTGVDNAIEATEATAEEQAAAETVPQEIMAIEPGFAEGVRNYDSGELIDQVVIIRRPELEPSPTEPEPEPPEQPGSEPTPSEPPAAPIESPESGDSSGAASPPTPPVRAVRQAASDGTYRVQSGDTLSIIANELLGDGNRWQEIFEANRDIIGDDPDGIRSGMELRIP